MKKKTILAATLAGVAAYALTNNYQRWKRDELTRIASRSQLVTTPLGPVEYAMQGEGPAVLMVHGSPGGYDQGLGLASLLTSPNFTYISPSRPGYLRTPLDSGVSPEAQADLFAALLDTLQIERVIVLAMSGGGAAALQFVLRYPERCRGLVMLCAITQRYVESEVYQRFPLPVRLGKQLINELLLFDPLLYGVQMLGKLANPGITANLLASLSPAYLRKTGYRNDMRQFASMIPYPLEQISVPTFIAQGTADTDLPFEHAQLLASKVPHAQLVPVLGAEHFFFVTHRNQFMPALREFLCKIA